MSDLSIFDIAGPIMVGPSSSHTAGACKIGQFARALFNRTPKKVTFYLHGSFAEVYKGHATDRALLGGVLKFQTSDPRIKNSFEIANEKKIHFKFVPTDLGPKCHPNTVKIVLEKGTHKMSVVGSSVGGGMIEINKIDDFKVLIHGRAGKYLSLVVAYNKNHQVIEQITKALKTLGIEVATAECSSFKGNALCVLSLDGPRITLPQVIEMEKLEGVNFIRSLSKLEKQ